MYPCDVIRELVPYLYEKVCVCLCDCQVSVCVHVTEMLGVFIFVKPEDVIKNIAQPNAL